METFSTLILDSGRTAVDLAIYILLPMMVVMLSIMHVLEAKGILWRIASFIAPVLAIVGIPGIGIFALLQLLLVSFAAPVATLAIMERRGISKPHLAATLATVFTMSQANVVFPMAAVGLNVPVTIASSIIGGLIAAACSYYFLKSRKTEDVFIAAENESICTTSKKRLSDLITEGGKEGMEIVAKSLPMLLMALLFVNLLKEINAVSFLQSLTAPVFELFGFKASLFLPVLTKYLAGGTAMMGVTMDMLQDSTVTAHEVNRIAGLIINPLDPVGIAVLGSVGQRTRSVVKFALFGAVIGILCRAIIHMLVFV